MAAGAGNLEINVATNIASVQQGFNALADIIGGSAQKITKEFDSLQGRFESITGAFQKLATIAVVGFSIKGLSDMVTGAIEAQAHLKDLAERVGSTAEALSSLIPAARKSGTSIEEVATMSVKFSRNLGEVQTGTGKAAAVFKELGFSASDAARFLKDPTQGIFEVSKALQRFQNDGGKTAAVMNLMGKNASALLPFFNQLAEESEIHARVTNLEAAAADALTDRWEDMKLKGESLLNSIASGLVPALQQLLDVFDQVTSTTGGFKQTVKDLAADGTLGIWLLQTAKAFAMVGEAIVAVAKLVSAIIGSFKVVASDIKSIGEDMVYAMSLGQIDIRTPIEERNKALEEANGKWKDLWDYNATAVSDSIDRQIKLLEKGREAVKQWADNSDRIDRYLRGQQGLNAPAATPKPSLTPGTDISEKFEAQLAKILTMAREADTELQSILSGKPLTAAQKALEALAESPEWKQFSAQQQKLIRGWAEYASGEQLALQATKDLEKVQRSLADTSFWTADYDKRLKEIDDLFAAGKITLEQYQEAGMKIYMSQPWFQKQREETERFVRAVTEAYEKQQKFLESTQVDIANYTDQTTELERQTDLLTLDERSRIAINEQLQIHAKLQAIINEGKRLENAGLTEEAAAMYDMAAQLQVQAQRRGEILTKQYDINKATEDQKSILADITNATEDFFKDLLENGSSAFKRLWDRFKMWALEALAKIAAQQIIVNIAGSLGFSGAALGGIAGGNPLSNLLGLGSTVSGAKGLAGLFSGGGGGILDALGLTGQSGGFLSSISEALGLGSLPSLSTAFTNLAGILPTFTTALEGGATAASAISTAFAGTAASFVPVVGWIAAAGAVIYSIIQGNKEPAKAKGQLQITSGTTGFEDNAYTASKYFGNIGFADVNTQQFSGEVGQVLNKLVAGALDAFGERMSSEGRDKLSEILKNMTFAAFEGTYTTEDFLKQFGGIALKQVVQAAFSVLNPAFESVIAGFEGTAEEVGNFTNTLLAINDLTKNFSDDFRANIAKALEGSTQEIADKVLAFASIITGFGGSLTELVPKLEALDPASMIAFIDALGGAQAALQSQAYIAENFSTTAERTARQSDALRKSFSDLGITLPDSTKGIHKWFTDLLASQDLTTESGRKAFASITALAQSFIQVYGTADQAAGAVDKVSDAFSSVFASASDAEDFFSKNFFTPSEQKQSAIDAANQKLADLDKSLGLVGFTIPRTNEGFRDLIKWLKDTGFEGTALYNTLIGEAAPALITINGAMQDVATSTDNATESLNALASGANLIASGTVIDSATNTVNELLDLFGQIGSAATGDAGAKLAQELSLIGNQIEIWQGKLAEVAHTSNTADELSITTVLNKLKDRQSILSTELSQFVIWKAQYGEAIAGQLLDLSKQYQAQIASIPNNEVHAAALAALKEQFDTRWNEIINGTKDGVDGTLSELDKLRQGILDYLNKLKIGNLSPLSPFQRFQEAQRQFDEQLAKAQAGDVGALGDITKFADDYLNLARDAFASSQTYTDIFARVQSTLTALATPPAAPGLPGDSTTIPTTATTTMSTADIAAAQFSALQGALPVGGDKLASSADIDALRATWGESMTAMAQLIAEAMTAANQAAERNAATLAASTRARPK